MGLSIKSFVILALTFANAAMAIDFASDVKVDAKTNLAQTRGWQDCATTPADILYFKTDAYQAKTRYEKMDDLWTIITEDTTVQPFYWKEQVQVFTSSSQNSFCQDSDEMKRDRLKLTHRQGVVAQAKWIPFHENADQFTGVYKTETDQVIIRLSETTNLTDSSSGLMPSLAMKFLHDGHQSSNLFGMPSFQGSGSWDFFANDFGSRVAPFTDEHPIEQQTMLLKLIEGSGRPFACAVSKIAEVELDGTVNATGDIHAPYELRWISSLAKDADYEREIDADTGEYANWYDIVMRDVKDQDIIFEVEGKLGPTGDWVKVADVQMMTDFTTSAFGDERLHFQHVSQRKDRLQWPTDWRRADDFVEYDQDETNEWNLGLDVPEERWPATDDEAKEFYLENVNNSAIGCPFGWLLDTIWTEHLAPEEILE